MTRAPLFLPGPSPVIALALGWVVPGGGHAYAGKWGKALLFFVLITALQVAGLVIGGGTVVVWRLWLFAQVCAGAPTLALYQLSQYFAIHSPIDWADRLHEMGTLYTAVAGLMNLLVMMDAYLRLAYPPRETEEDA